MMDVVVTVDIAMKYVFIMKGVMMMIKFIISLIEHMWMDSVREAQREYNKPIILNKNDGSDWKRELI